MQAESHTHGDHYDNKDGHQGLVCEELGESNSWFADYVIGEYYLKSGDTEKAYKLLSSSNSLISNSDDFENKPEQWLIDRIRNRLKMLNKSRR